MARTMTVVMASWIMFTLVMIVLLGLLLWGWNIYPYSNQKGSTHYLPFQDIPSLQKARIEAKPRSALPRNKLEKPEDSQRP